MFWLEENLIFSNVLITGKSNFDEKNVKEMFNWSEVHSEKKYYLWNRDFSYLGFRFHSPLVWCKKNDYKIVNKWKDLLYLFDLNIFKPSIIESRVSLIRLLIWSFSIPSVWIGGRILMVTFPLLNFSALDQGLLITDGRNSNEMLILPTDIMYCRGIFRILILWVLSVNKVFI